MALVTTGRAMACAAALLALAACSDMGWNTGRSGTSGWSGSSTGMNNTGMNSGGSAAANDESMGSRSTTPEANIPTQQ